MRRSITQSFGRFMAIVVISFLGAGFYGGLRMAAPDMRIAGDEFLDATNTYDISVVSTLGLDETSLDELRAVEGVGEVQGAYRTDVIVLTGDSSYAASVESLDMDAARASDTSDGVHAYSDDAGYLNRPILEEGTWPTQANECVVSADAAEKLNIELGSTLTFEKGTTDLDDMFSERTYTVTGFVNSPTFMSTDQYGSTSLASGTYDLYLYVPLEAIADDAVYTVAYMTVPSALSETWDTDGYDQAVAPVKERVEDIADEIGASRYDRVRSEAQSELDDARADYESERADAEAELADAEAELVDARAQLDDAAASVASGKAELDDAAAQLADSEAQLNDGEAQYAEGVAQLAQQKAEAEQQFTDSKKQIDTQRAYLEQQLEQAQAAGADAETIAQLEQAIAQLDAGQAQLDAEKAQAEQQFAEADATLAATRAQLDEGWAELESGRASYNEGLASYQSGLEEYLSGESDYADGVEELANARAEADEKFADAEAELADAQRDIDDIEEPSTYVLGRDKNVGCACLSSDAEGIEQIALFFPFMFFLVAALVSLTSMTRMVDEERMIIGTHKALGYAKSRIRSKYVVYGVLASGIGSVAGIVVLGKLLPWFIMVSYHITYAVPVYPTPLDPVTTIKAIGLSVGVTLLATWWAVSAEMREKPAALMLPRAPKAGKRIILERITPIWSRLSFSHKVTARNLLRFKRRFWMVVIGIAGCTALLMIGFGLHDCIGGIVQNQFEKLINYDLIVRVDEDATDDQRTEIQGVLDQLATEGTRSLEVQESNMVAYKTDGDQQRIEVVVPTNGGDLSAFVNLRNRTTQEGLLLESDGVVLSEKTAEVAGVSVGDTITLYDENDIGEADGEGYSFVVSGITENYLGHYAYMDEQTYKEAFGTSPSTNGIYVMMADDSDDEATGQVTETLLACDGVNAVTRITDTISDYDRMLDVMDKLIYIIVAAAAALAFVVLYNLTNINIDERVREIATLKVLGFTPREVNQYIFREIMIMALIGAIIGCILGVPLTLYIAQAAETANMMFGRTIAVASYVLSFGLTMLFAWIVMLTMRPKLAHVSMVESLKSVE